MFYTTLCAGHGQRHIYDSRNYICIYTLRIHPRHARPIYDSRNYICIYTRMWYNNIWWQIYDSRNYICIYTTIIKQLSAPVSTIVEIIYVFTPKIEAYDTQPESTIVEIIYVFTPGLRL